MNSSICLFYYVHTHTLAHVNSQKKNGFGGLEADIASYQPLFPPPDWGTSMRTTASNLFRYPLLRRVFSTIWRM